MAFFKRLLPTCTAIAIGGLFVHRYSSSVNHAQPSQSPKETLIIGIVGGSMSGLFAARALQSLGHEIHVFERRNGLMTGGGITVTSPLMEYVDKHEIFVDRKSKDDNLIPTTTTSTIGHDSTISTKSHPDVIRRHTSWDCLFWNLLNDDLASRYHQGKNLCDIIQNQDGNHLMRLLFDDGSVFDCDLVIGADGVGSKTRTFIACNASKELEYAGYVAWRGTVNTHQVEQHLKSISHWPAEHQWVLYHGANTQFLNYIVPNHQSPDDKLFNWVWYCKYTTEELQKQSFLIDKHNQKRLHSMPRGELSQPSLIYVAHLADELLEETCAELVKLTKEPFYQVIYDYKCSQMAEYRHSDTNEGGIILVGDAAFVLRPHITKATSKASGDALALEKYLTQYKDQQITLKQALSLYNEERMAEGIDLSNKSIELGNAVVLEIKDRDFNQEYVRSSR